MEVTAKYGPTAETPGLCPIASSRCTTICWGTCRQRGWTSATAVGDEPVMQGLISAIDADLLTRAYNDGSETNAAQAAQTLAWDMAKGYVPAASGTLTATDVDAGDV